MAKSTKKAAPKPAARSAGKKSVAVKDVAGKSTKGVKGGVVAKISATSTSISSTSTLAARVKKAFE